MSFDTPPEPLTRMQKAIVIAIAVACAATRFLAMSRSVWDWDEALFTMAMRDYDVSLHHPHPPGFPVYIALARLMRFVVADDFRALQSVNMIAAVLVFPAMFLFARELRLRFPTAVIAATLFTFFPNVWFFGGGAFSDVPSIVLVLFAVTFLFKGVRDRKMYWLGTLLLALAAGIRPQNFLVGLIPGILATRKRRWWEILIALLIGVAVVGTAFGAAIHATGSVDEYLRIVREHSDYITRVDSFRSPARPPLWRLADRFFIKQYQSPVLSVITSLFVVLSIVGSIRDRNRSILWNVLTFLPFAILAWLMLDRYSVSRFSIGYQPMFAILAADGIRRAAKRFSDPSSAFGTFSPRGGEKGARGTQSSSAPLPAGGERVPKAGEGRGLMDFHEAAIAAVLIAVFFFYTLPALTPVRNEVAPSIVAAQTAAQRVDPRREQLFVAHTMVVFMDLVAPGIPYTHVLDDRALPLAAKERAWLLSEITATQEEGLLFRRERGRLWNIARRHYFEIKLAPIDEHARFLAGWGAAESSGEHQWRWMGRHSVTHLPPRRGETLLRLQFDVPGERRSAITIELNGRVVDELQVEGSSVERDYRVTPAPRDLPNVLELSVGHDRGLKLRSLSWGPA